MGNTPKPFVRISEEALQPFSHGQKYQSDDLPLSEKLGLTQIGACYCEVPAGKTACPFHVHHCEDEMFIILEGEGAYRFGEETYAVKAGDVLGAPRGGG